MGRRHIALLLALALALGLWGCGAGGGAPGQAAQGYDYEALFTLTGWESGHAPVALAAMDMNLPDMEEMAAEIERLTKTMEESASLPEAFDCLMEAKQLFDGYDSVYALYVLYSDWDGADEGYAAGLQFCEENYAQTELWWSDFYWTISDGPYVETLLPLWLTPEEEDGPRNYNNYRSEQLSGEIAALCDEALLLLDSATVRWAGRDVTLAESLAAWDWETAGSVWLEAHGPALLECYTALVAARGALARECYRAESFSHYSFSDYRWDYTPEMAGSLIGDIVTWLLPLDEELTDGGYWTKRYDDYLDKEALIARAAPVFAEMGEAVAAAFALLLDYDLWVSETNEHNADRPYANYLPLYRVAVIFCPYYGDGASVLEFAHEFGHFYEYYRNLDGYSRGLDLSELHSQGMTLLFAEQYGRQYGEDSLRELALVDVVDTLVHQSYNAAIELAAYALPEEELTAAYLLEIGREVSARFDYAEGSGAMADYHWLADEELFTDPFRSFGYVASAGAALELWALARTDMDAALRQYEMVVHHRRGEAFVQNLRWAQIQSPFADDWAKEAAALLRGALFPAAGAAEAA